MSISDWKITFDPLELLSEKKDFDQLMPEAIEQDEDILQIENINNKRILDLGWYREEFGIYLVAGDWDNPILNERFKKLTEAMARFHEIATDEGIRTSH